MKTISSGIFLINNNNELLVCHPTNHNPNFWSIPKGRVESDESLLDAAIRETYEETNILLTKDLNFIALPMVDYKHGNKALASFLFLEEENPSVNLKSFEIKCMSMVSNDGDSFFEMDDFKWVSLNEAKEMLHETQSYLIDEIFSKLKKVY